MSNNLEPAKKPRAILVIDDDQATLLGLKNLLGRNGYIVTICSDSRNSLKLAEESRPELIICDIMMPWLDGFKTREALAANPTTRDIPFLFLSARDTQAAKVRGFQEGVDDYITKPFDPDELVARIDSIFHSQKRDQDKVIREISRQIERIQTEISHNIPGETQTSTSQILLALEKILREKYQDPEKLKQYVETVISQSLRLNTLANDLQFLTAFEKGPTFYLRQAVDIQHDFILPINKRGELYHEKNLQVNIQTAEGIHIHAPRREFTQVVTHIVDNAFKFAPPKTSVLIDLAANGEGGCILTVTDHGPGIPAEQREKVFERFYQIDPENNPQPDGLGLGLTIARPITRSLGGDVFFLPDEHRCLVQMTLPPAPLDMQ